MRDHKSNIRARMLLSPSIATTDAGDIESEVMDLEGAQSFTLLTGIGAKHADDAFSAENAVAFKVYHSDKADAEFEPVERNDALDTIEEGQYLDIDSEAACNQLYKFGYVGSKRFIKVVAKPRGAIANGVSVTILGIKSHLTH
jgi:hypothetical protein